MSKKTEATEIETVASIAADPAPTVSLDEFCSRLSETVSSPECIGGFHYTERAAGRLRDTSEAYKARFDEFLIKPV